MSQPVQEEFDLGTEVSVVFPLVPVEPFRFHLAPFTGKRPCPKCGSEYPRAVWHDGQVVAQWLPCWGLYESIPRDPAGRPTDPMPEHLDRECATCQYRWTEDVKRDGDGSEE